MEDNGPMSDEDLKLERQQGATNNQASGGSKDGISGNSNGKPLNKSPNKSPNKSLNKLEHADTGELPPCCTGTATRSSQRFSRFFSRNYWRGYWGKFKKFIVHDILRADDTPHRLALGAAIGIFVALTPTIPFQMAITLVLAWMLKANKAVGLPFVWLTNPATAIPVYFGQYLLGCKLLGIAPGAVSFQVLAEKHADIWTYAAEVWQLSVAIFWPLWAGSLVCSTLLAILTYYLFRGAIMRYRKARYGSVFILSKK